MLSVLWPLWTSLGVTACAWLLDRKLVPGEHAERRFTSLFLLAVSVWNITLMDDWQFRVFPWQSNVLPLIRVFEWLLIRATMCLGAIAGVGAMMELFCSARCCCWRLWLLPLAALAAYSTAVYEFYWLIGIELD